MKPQRCYNGVRLLGDGPCLANVAKIDAGALPMIHTMARRGLQVDLSHFARMEQVLIEDMDRLTEDVRTLTGTYCNLDSSPQVSKLLFKTMGLIQARPKMTRSGDRESTENEVLVAIQHDHEVVGLILDYRELSKLKGTYVSPMPRLAQRTAAGHWRLYPNFNTTRVPSGRLSCKAPNLLAMPNRTARGREICQGFITDPGWVFLSVDESQIEPRTVAHRSHDSALMEVYFNQEDIYSDFAIAAFRLPDTRTRDSTSGQWHYPGVDPKRHRFPAKTCTLASIYDVTGMGLLEQMPIVCRVCGREGSQHRAVEGRTPCPGFSALWTETNCQQLITSFYQRYPGIMSMRKTDHRRAREFGYIWDDWGRLLHVAAVRSVLEWVVSAALREVGNFPIQSTAQGTVKLTMAAVQDDLVAAGMLGEVVWPLLQIHDELLFECREDMAEEVGVHVASRFETCVRFDVPLKAGAATASTWGSLQK